MQYLTMSKRSLEDGEFTSDNDQESDDATSSSKKRRATGPCLTADDKMGIASVSSRPRKMSKQIQADFVDMVEKRTPVRSKPPSSTTILGGPDVVSLDLQGIQQGTLTAGTVPNTTHDGNRVTALPSSSTEVEDFLMSRIATNEGTSTGTGQTQPSDLHPRVQQRALPVTAVPFNLLLPASTNQHLRDSSYRRLHNMPNTAYPSLDSAFLQQKFINSRLASRVSNAMQDLMGLELLQNRLRNLPSSILQQNIQQQPNRPSLASSTQMRDFLATMQMAGSSSLLNNRGIQLDPSSGIVMNPYLQSSLPLDARLSGTQPPMNVPFGMRLTASAYARPFQVPQQGGIGLLGSSDSQRQQDQHVGVDHREDIPVLSRDIGRVEPMELETDSASLSPFQCLARQQIEFFEAKESDVAAGARGRNNPISLGQVGIRCRHCKSSSPTTRGRAAVYFPTKFDLVYQTAVNMTSTHLCTHCKEVPTETRDQLVRLRDQRSTVGGGKSYWAEATKILGIVETQRGLRFKE
jgi:hypothetical protein